MTTERLDNLGDNVPLNSRGTVSPASEAPRPVITIMHASVGSGHRAAAMAIAQAVENMRGAHGVPDDVEVDVLDVLDFGRIKFDGNKTAAASRAHEAHLRCYVALYAHGQIALGRWIGVVQNHVPLI